MDYEDQQAEQEHHCEMVRGGWLGRTTKGHTAANAGRPRTGNVKPYGARVAFCNEARNLSSNRCNACSSSARSKLRQGGIADDHDITPTYFGTADQKHVTHMPG